MSAAALLAELRQRGLEVARVGDRIRYRGPRGAMTPDLAARVRAERAGLLVLLDRDDDPALWRARFERRAAELRFAEGFERDAARDRAALELAVEWTLGHPDVDALPSTEAEPIAVAALEAFGIRDPRTGGANAASEARCYLIRRGPPEAVLGKLSIERRESPQAEIRNRATIGAAIRGRGNARRSNGSG